MENIDIESLIYYDDVVKCFMLPLQNKIIPLCADGIYEAVIEAKMITNNGYSRNY